MSKIANFRRLISNILHKRTEYLPKFKKLFGAFGENSVIEHPSNITFHKNIFIGNNTTILNNSRINIYNYLTQNNANITIGNNCYIGTHLSILVGADITIGNEVFIASNVLITSESHGMDPESNIPYMDQPLICKPITIGDGTWIGEKVCILPGVNIGKKCVIGAASVVTKDIPDYSIAVGNPARIIKKYKFEKHSWEKFNN